MIADNPSRLVEFLDWLGPKVKRALKRARKRWRNRNAARKPRRKKRGKALSDAGRALARKRWSGQKASSKAGKKRAPKTAAYTYPNVIAFPRRRAGNSR